VLADAEVRGAEVVAPLGNAVRLVDGREADAGLAERLEELRRAERLGRRHQKDRAARLEPFERGTPRLATDGAVEAHDRHVELLELRVLILEKCQQRRAQHHRLRQRHRRDLVAGRLAVAGRQHDEDVAAAGGFADDPLLFGVEAVETESTRRELDRASDLGAIRAAVTAAFPPPAPASASPRLLLLSVLEAAFAAALALLRGTALSGRAGCRATRRCGRRRVDARLRAPRLSIAALPVGALPVVPLPVWTLPFVSTPAPTAATPTRARRALGSWSALRAWTAFGARSTFRLPHAFRTWCALRDGSRHRSGGWGDDDGRGLLCRSRRCDGSGPFRGWRDGRGCLRRRT
jgi:hypothetical protein